MGRDYKKPGCQMKPRHRQKFAEGGFVKAFNAFYKPSKAGPGEYEKKKPDDATLEITVDGSDKDVTMG